MRVGTCAFVVEDVVRIVDRTHDPERTHGPHPVKVVFRDGAVEEFHGPDADAIRAYVGLLPKLGPVGPAP